MSVTSTAPRGHAPSTQSWAAHVAATIALGIPLVGTQLAQVAINATDVVMLGRLGATDLAAGVLATQMFFLFYIFGAGFTHAIVPIAAHAEGAGDRTAVRRAVRMGLWVVALYGLLTAIPLHFAEPLLVAFGQKPEVAALAGRYMHVGQWAIFPALFVMTMRAFFAVAGRAQIILWATIAGTLFNGFVGYAFIFGRFGAPQMGIVGAAIGSLATNCLVFTMLATCAARLPGLKAYEIFVRLWRPDWPVFREVVRLGLPIALTIIAEVGLFSTASLMMGWLGTVDLAAHGIALQLASIAFMIPLGLANAGTVRVGQAFGRGDQVGLARAAIVVLLIALSVAIAGAALFWLFPEQLIRLYLDAGDPLSDAVVATAVPFLAVAAVFQVADSLQAIGSGLLRALKDTRVPLLIAVFSYWGIGMPLAYGLAFPAGLRGVGIWIGLAVGLFVAAILMNLRFRRRAVLARA